MTDGPSQRPRGAVRRASFPVALVGGLLVGPVAWLYAQSPPTEPAAPSAAPTTAPATQPAVSPEAVRSRLVTGLVGSKHDFTGDGRLGRDLCLPCHTPHLLLGKSPDLDERPDATPPLRPFQTRGAELDGWSLLCLGCHDGVTAPDVYASGHAVRVATEVGDPRLGTKGLRSHPVGVAYPTGDPAFRTAAEVEAAGLSLSNGRIQCGTCHDAHNTRGHDGMLKISNERSRVCLACHRV